MTRTERPLDVVFLIDALGWEIAEHFSFARDIFPRRSPLGTILGYSSAAIPSLLSGEAPSQHGSWAMFRKAGSAGPFSYLRHLPRLPASLDWRARQAVRRITDKRGVIRGYYDLYDIPTHLLPHFDVATHGDPYVPGGIASETIFDRMTREKTPYRMWYFRTAESDNMTDLVDSLDGEERVLFLYTAELDSLMHRVGIFDEAVAQRLRRYERFLERVVDRARTVGRDIRLHVLSDHGMTDVHDDIDVLGPLQGKGLRCGRDYLAFFDATMVRVWGDERAIASAAAVLTEAGKGRRLSDDELRAYGCHFPGREYGDAILLADPGVMIVPSFMGRTRLAAMHGYDPAHAFSRGCFMTTGDGAVPASILEFKGCFFAQLRNGA